MTCLWERFDRIVVFDTETTGIDFQRDCLIELGAVALGPEGEEDSCNALLRLPQGRTLPPVITQLTGITSELLEKEGVEWATAAQAFCRLLETERPTLLCAYNAQFDLNFLYPFLLAQHRAEVLRRLKFLDVLTVYRDRRDYPHKLCHAIEAYRIPQVSNSHRAVDDARAAAAVLEAMAAERQDLENYINLFGVHPKYGMSGRKIASVTYCPQPYQRKAPLYELAGKM